MNSLKRVLVGHDNPLPRWSLVQLVAIPFVSWHLYLPKPGKGEPAVKLSERQSEELRPKLIDATRQYFDLMDTLLAAAVSPKFPGKWGLTVNVETRITAVTIWGNLDDQELGVLVDSWLARAQRSGRVARQAKRAVSLYQEMIVPGVILVPRLRDTFMLIMSNGVRIRP
jgi:hypothetical protein